MRTIPPSELIINGDGSVFHLHLKPSQLADLVILVGDPGRVDMVAGMFDECECRVESREFRTVTGKYKGRRMSVLSTGIGTDNIDIVVTELDALANVDFESRSVKAEHKTLTLVRLGTSGALQADLPVGTQLMSRTSVGFDGLLGYYEGRDSVCDVEMERSFVEYMGWGEKLPVPYFVNASEDLVRLFADSTVEGITISAPGFYGPQGRMVRLRPSMGEDMNRRIAEWNYCGRRITNYEMEGSALAALAALLGHRAITICTIIAQRVVGSAQTDYRPFVEAMVRMALDKLATL
ncbi:MAG: nucleoside phosphorylase [Rikenellaceae bacterium]|nr:nucleoside phosphorylase [Rikenellaceae bacterium]